MGDYCWMTDKDTSEKDLEATYQSNQVLKEKSNWEFINTRVVLCK